MSKNIKEIGKELLGKSLNSFHRKTGLTQLEENNKMQDGILDGILSQVDDAYIDKTEQSNVIHLDGSGDGVVILDSIEGNTMVNIIKNANWNVSTDKTLAYMNVDWSLLKPNTVYTYFVLNLSEKINTDNAFLGKNFIKQRPYNISKPCLATTVSDLSVGGTPQPHLYVKSGQEFTQDDFKNLKLVMLEGDYTDKDINFFEGLQSSFEEKVNDEGKYEIEILSKNKNLLDIDYLEDLNNYIKNNYAYNSIPIKLKPNTTYTISLDKIGTPLSQIVLNVGYGIWESPQNHYILSNIFNVRNAQNNPKQVTFTTTNQSVYYLQYYENGHNTSNADMNQWFTRICENLILEEGSGKSDYVPNKQNKIKLLINEPLRATDTVKDKMCIKDNRLVVERNCGEVIFDGEENWQDDWQNLEQDAYIYFYLTYDDFGNYAKHPARTESVRIVSDYFYEAYCNSSVWATSNEKVAVHTDSNFYYFQVSMLKSKLSSLDKQGFKNFIKLRNGLKFVYKLAEPFYEEVLNEYGEPILLEGYESGTIYIDSTIVPTTSVRYTPKMESFKTLKEVEDNNIMLTNDINDNIIPYLMDVDLMIMEKEMALPSQINIRKMEVLDMTSMQKRTQDMLERLIKGKTLTEQECKTRITTYLHAGKITDAQAKELNFLIDEIYA